MDLLDRNSPPQADMHGNPAHLMLDSTFPFAISLLRLRASLVATHSSKQRVSSVIERILAGDFSDPPTPREHFVSQLPDVVSGNFTFLVYDAPGYINFHRGKPERQWTAQLAGNGAVDVQELASVCPSGCLVRTAWAGAGHVGLCPVDRFNAMGGASEQRALFRFRHRIYHMWKVPPHPPPPAIAGSAHAPLPQVLVVETKRRVTNLNAFVARINAEGFASARLIKWEALPFAEQLKAMRGAAVQVSGVGSSQINQFLLPRGAVAICLGWRSEASRHGIVYFDSHILRSMDHVRVLYYPSYSRAERSCGAESVCLDLGKATNLVREGVELHKSGFSVPVPSTANANKYDRAFERLVELTGGKALQHRTNDYAWDDARERVDGKCTSFNGVDQMLFSPASRSCMWSHLVPRLKQEFDL